MILAIKLSWIGNVFGLIKNVHVVKMKLTNLKLNFLDAYLIQVSIMPINME